MYDRAHFEGAWPDAEIRIVAAAIFRAESRFGEPPSPAYGKTWVCVREKIDDARTLYVASRFGYHDTIKALTAGSLAAKIEDFGEVGVPYANPF